MNSVPMWVPLIGSVGTVFIALAAWAGFRLVQLRTLEVQERSYKKTIDDRFDELSVFFWTDKKIERGREIVTYDEDYETVRPHLWRMAKTPEVGVPVSPPIREDIEAINCFCACITRVNLLGGLDLTPEQNKLSEAIFGYWRSEIYKDSRMALGAYFDRYWAEPIGEEGKRWTSITSDETPSIAADEEGRS